MSNNNQRSTPANRLIDAAFTNNMKDVYTGIAGHVIAFDSMTQRAQVQIGVIRVNVDGTTFNPPPIVDVPVQFPGDDFTLEFQIDPGCEGYIHFSQRCLDGWKQTGGIADNPVARFHNKQDAFFSPGGRSLGNVITGFSNNGMRLRNKDGTQRVWLKNDGACHMENGTGYIRLLPDGSVTINGVRIDKDGNITAPNSLMLAGKELKDHKHHVNGTNADSGPNL